MPLNSNFDKVERVTKENIYRHALCPSSGDIKVTDHKGNDGSCMIIFNVKSIMISKGVSGDRKIRV